MENKNSTNLMNCDYCDYCYSCNSCDSCDYCDSCNSCYSCNYCNSCDYCKNLKMAEYNLFCYSENYNDENSFQQKRHRAFNKEVGDKRYCEIRDLISTILKDFKLELNENYWTNEWKKVTDNQWRQILAIPEADKSVIEAIIGFELKLGDTQTINIEGKQYTIDEIKKALNK